MPGSTAEDIGRRVAGPAADAVDREARFPAEAVAELRSSGLLSALVPPSLGGPGLTVAQMSREVTVLARYCSSSALVLAMHSIQVACLLNHATPVTMGRLLPGLMSGDLLLGNANSEVGLNGERRSSLCALEPRDGGLWLEKQASTVSYGEYADGLLTTVRREPSSPPNDQVMAICLAPAMSFTPSGPWDTMGMRGTCSRPGLLQATVSPDLILDDYGDVFARTSLPVSAVLLSSVWLGLAEAGARRAHACVRAHGRRLRATAPDAPPPTSALRLAELGVVLHQLREVLAGGAREYERVKGTPELTTLGFSGRMDNLKLASSTLVGDVVTRAMFICGLAGYSNETDLSIARISRDAAAAPLMVNNDRALMATARTLMLRKDL